MFCFSVLELGDFSVHQLILEFSNLLGGKRVSMPIYALQWKIMVLLIVMV